MHCIIALTFHDPFCVEAANNCHVADALIRYREEIFHQVEMETRFRNAFFPVRILRRLPPLPATLVFHDPDNFSAEAQQNIYC